MGCLVWLEGRIYTKRQLKDETLEQRVGNRSHKNRFMACPTEVEPLIEIWNTRKAKFYVYVMLCGGLERKS